MKQHLITALATTAGLAVGSLVTTALNSATQPKSASMIESLKAGGIVNVDEFGHNLDGYEGKCTTDVVLIQSISTDENLTGSLEIGYKDSAQSAGGIAYGYVKDGKGFVTITAYDYSKKSCNHETAGDYAISEVLYATVTPGPVFVGAKAN